MRRRFRHAVQVNPRPWRQLSTLELFRNTSIQPAGFCCGLFTFYRLERHRLERPGLADMRLEQLALVVGGAAFHGVKLFPSRAATALGKRTNMRPCAFIAPA